ncbi:hypothetical protein ACUNV4_09985 [Granulosicoccus sp. 3-233]|uniref:hypothetical protein n=1 Tax=Granulosicoccus sp. 3-233 TaxID=3417969 RepID=UPI003D357380
MFELLFNYPVELWQQARLSFEADLPLWGLPAAMAVVALLILVSLWRRDISLARRGSIAVLQGLLAAVVLIMIWQPVLQVSVAERGENTVAWVLDGSRSMSLQDVSATGSVASFGEPLSRLEAGRQAVQELAIQDTDEFSARLYRLGDGLSSLDTLDEVSNQDPASRSNIAPALDELLGTVSESALAAVVLISDGADNSDRIDSRWWQTLAAAGVPVHTVGVGQPEDPADLELAEVFMPDTAQPNTELTARVRIRHGAAGIARVRVMSGTELLAAEDVRLPEDVGESIHSLSFSSGDSGTRQLEFSVEATQDEGSENTPDDPVPANNRQPRILRVVDAPRRILYVEGEPRWEYKFLRRAMDAHPGVTVVSLLRTSPNKFYRQGVRDGNELADGFPTTREQLFAYDAVVIGSLEAAELSTAQQSALRDFVSLRGGTLLMLGGRQGLADGGWGRSVVAAALPVQLGSRPGAETFDRQRASVMPSLTGLRTPWLQLADGTQANIDAWQSLPELADHQSLGQVKPGALTLLEQVAGNTSRRSEPLLVAQRYGRGQSLVLGTSGTWRWQMRLPSEDMRHERFWRQLLGMTVEQSLPRLRLQTDKPVYRDADTANLSLLAYNADYTDLQVSELPVALSAPDGSTQTVALYPDNDRPGHYSGQIPMHLDGPYSVASSTPLEGESPSAPLSSVEQWWVRESGNAEDFGSGLQADFLQRISEVSGGSYLPLSDIDRLNSILASENAALKRESHLPLWNMPFLFLCVILLKLFEWALRLRWKRL